MTDKLARIRAALGLTPETDSLHARHNLMGAVIDTERQGKADAVCLKTFKRVERQLADVEAILEEDTS